MPPKKGFPLSVSLSKDTGKNLKITAYVFNSQGENIERISLKNGEGLTAHSIDDLHGSKVIIAPELPEDQPVNPDMLLRMRGIEATLNKNKIGEKITQLSDELLKCWIGWPCHVKGKVTNWYYIDGAWVQKPVCHARVHICEIDRLPYIIYRIPDDIILRVKDIIIKPPKKFVYPDPPVRFPLPPDPVPYNTKIKLMQDPVNKSMNLFNPPVLRQSEMKYKPEEMITESVKKQFMAESPTLLRNAIIQNFQVLTPYFCWFDWIWPWFYSSQQLAIAYTDCNGLFDKTIYYHYFDKPDIYIWIEYEINGVWTTVYRPYVPCNTYWNYLCGSNINISLYDPRIKMCSCDVLPGDIVWVRTIGHSSVRRIEQGTFTTDNVQGVVRRTVGLTDYSDPSGKKVCPYGGSLGFWVQFGSGLPDSAITHFRWKYRRIRDANLNSVSEPFEVYKSALYKPYTIEIMVSGSPQIYTKYYQLGPEGSGNNSAYKIPHADPNADVPVADRGPGTHWDQNTLTFAIDSTSLQDGLYEFVLELCKQSGSSYNVVNPAANTFKVPKVNNIYQSENAPPEYLSLSSGKTVYRMKVRIDNAPCVADIQDVILLDHSGNPILDSNGNTIKNGKCGFINYQNDVNNKVLLSFIAHHPRGFARHYFGCVKGNNTEYIGGFTNTSGFVFSDMQLAGVKYDLNTPTHIFSRKLLIQDLLGTCPQAAFAENLTLHAMATNGINRLNGYDRYDTNAFALSNT